MARNPLNRWISSIITLSDEMSIEFDWNISERWKYLSSVKIEHYKCLHFNYANITTDIHSFFYLPINITELVASIFECQRHNLWEGGKKSTNINVECFQISINFIYFFAFRHIDSTTDFFRCFSSVPQKLVDFTEKQLPKIGNHNLAWQTKGEKSFWFALCISCRIELNCKTISTQQAFGDVVPQFVAS